MSTPGAAAAAAGQVSANDPDEMANVLIAAGYEAETDIDDYGDPLIHAEFQGYPGRIVFYGCDETSHENCDSVQFTVGLDRAEPMPLTQVNEILSRERFVSIGLDDEGDPWLTWDVVTLDGIPTKVFLNAIEQYASQVAAIAEEVFAEQS